MSNANQRLNKKVEAGFVSLLDAKKRTYSAILLRMGNIRIRIAMGQPTLYEKPGSTRFFGCRNPDNLFVCSELRGKIKIKSIHIYYTTLLGVMIF